MTRCAYHDFAQAGVAFLPAGRLEEGLIKGMTLTEHFALTLPGKRALGELVATRGASPPSASHILTSKDGPTARSKPCPAATSSGSRCRCCRRICDCCCWNIPRAAWTSKAPITSGNSFSSGASEGTAIIFISAELDEIVTYSDRILVFFGGRATLVDDPAEMTADRLGELIGGRM